MKLNPQQGPLYGECVLTVQLDDDDMCRAEEEEEEEESTEFYLLFSGSTQKHLTSTLRVSRVTLQAVCPAHNVCEQVLVTLCLGRPSGQVNTPSQEPFCFVKDSALDMARCLHDKTPTQETLLLDNVQCEGLDESPALPQKQLALTHQTTAPGTHSQTRVDGQMGNQTLTVSDTEAHTHSDTNRHDTQTRKETWMDEPTQLHSCNAVSQCQQLSSLQHLAASHCVRTPTPGVLQEPGGREALRTQAESRGHHQLVDLFAQPEISSNVQVEPKDHLHFNQKGRVFQHHPNLGTYTQTFPSLEKKEGGAGTQSGGDCCLQEEVAELRRLIRLHRDKKESLDCPGTMAPTHASTLPSIDHEVVSSICGLRPCFNSQQGSKQDTSLTVVTMKICGTPTKEQESPLSLDKRTQGEDSAVVTHTSCTSGSFCQSQEAGREQRGTPAAKNKSKSNRKNQKRATKTTRHAAESLRNEIVTSEASSATALKPAKTAGTRAETDGTISPREPAMATVFGERGATLTQCNPRIKNAPLPIKPLSALGGDGKCAGRKAVALPTTTTVEKQEGEKWEVDLLMCEGVTKTETVAETEQGDTESLHEKEAKFNVALESAAERTVTMGQEQSQDHQKSQTDSDDPCQPDTMNKSPQSGSSPESLHMERKPKKQDGGWSGSRTGSPPHGPETVAKTVWYQGENVDQVVGENLNRQERSSQSVWYYSDTEGQRKHEQLEQRMGEKKECGLSSPQALSSVQLLEQVVVSSYQPSAAISQPHAAGTQPALSHGPATQRQEVRELQQEEEVVPDWKEEGVEGDREEVKHRERTYSRKSSKTAGISAGGEEKLGHKENGTKGNKKKRKKRGKRGNTETKLSSSPETQSQREIQTQREQANQNIQSETESEAKDKTGVTDIQSLCALQPRGGDAYKDALHLPSETEDQARDVHGLDNDVANLDPGYTALDFSPTEDRTTDLTEVSASQAIITKASPEDESMNFHRPVDCNRHSSVTTSGLHKIDISKADIDKITTDELEGEELLDPTELDLKCLSSPVQQMVHNVESNASSGNAVASEDQTDLVESIYPKELPFQNSDPKEFIEDCFLMEFPEPNTQHVGLKSVDSNKPEQPVDPLGGSIGLMESVRPTEAGYLPSESTADVSPLQKGETRVETTKGKYLEHCLASETLKGLQHKEEKSTDSCVGEEEADTDIIWERSEENDSGIVHGNKSSSIDSGGNVEDEDFPSLNREEEQRYSEDLVATAVAIVTVAIASAINIELGQMLADHQSENQESVSKELVNQPLALDANLSTDTLNQLADDLVNTVQPAQESAQLMDTETCQVLAMTETEDQPIENSNIEPTDQFKSKQQANVKLSDEVQRKTQTEKQLATELSSNQQANLDLAVPADNPSLSHLDKEEIQTESTQNKVFMLCPLPSEDSQLQILKPLPEVSEIITTEIDGQSLMQSEIQQEESLLSCPVVDTGQHPEVSDTSCPDSNENLQQGDRRDPQDQSICQKESGIQTDRPQPDLHFQHNQILEKDESHLVESRIAEGEVGRKAQEQCKAETSESWEKSFSDLSDSHSQPGKQGESPTSSFSCSLTLPFTPCNSTSDPSPEEPTAPVDVTNQSTQSLADMELVHAIPLAHADSSTLQTKGQESVAMDNEDMFKRLDDNSDTFDTVDGWKERQRNMMKNEEETRKEMVTVKDTSQTEAETFQAGKEECGQTRRDSDSTHTLQIQREKDVFYPVQPYCQTNTEATCTDIYPDSEECVSVCLLHRDIDSQNVSAKLQDNVFKKPEDPPACVAHRAVDVSWSSTDDGTTQRAPGSHEGAVSAGSPDAVAPLSPRLPWRSDTEDGGGGETEAGKEEEKRDQLPDNLLSSAILRASTHSLSPHRRHSWEPGRNNAPAENDIIQRSSLKSLSGEAKRAKPPLHRRSMSWCPSNLLCPGPEHIDNRSYSLEGLEVERPAAQAQCSYPSDGKEGTAGRSSHLVSQERGSLVSLTEEDSDRYGSSADGQKSHQVLSGTISCPPMFHHQALTKSISMVAISHRDMDVVSSLSSNSGSLEYSISEEPGPLRSDTEGKGGPKISRTFSYLRSKMSKKGREKERKGERERENKEREKKGVNGHLFISVSPSPSTACQHCTKLLYNKETFFCNNCGVQVHKCCRESLSVCTKSKTKQPLVPEAVPGSAVNMRSKSTSSTSSVSSTSSSSSRERWSTATTPDDQLTVVFPRRHPSIFNPHNSLAKSISTSNIAGLDEVPLKGLKFLSQSTDSLHQGGKVSASTESLCDEGTEMMDSQLMGEFECDIKDLEADSWSSTVDKKFLKVLKKDEIKKQDVIYELYQTEFHHVRTLKIMSEVYYKGLQKELQLDIQTLDKIFPVLDNLLDIHTCFLTLLLDKKRASSTEGQNNSFLISNIGDVLVNQFTGCSADRMKKAYGKFCSRHNEAVTLYKDLHSKDKRFQNFIKRTMTSNLVRRLSIPECILLVTQRITKYPVLIQRILQHTKDSDKDHSCVCEALRCVKELILAVDNKVNEQEKKQRLMEVYSRTDSKSIMRMKSGQMFAKEDLIRGRKLLHDGALQLKNSTGRLKDVHAMLLSDVLLFLQEKDQKYVFASLDQRSTVISLQNLIVREVANEERGLFLITAGTDRPEMVEVLASSKEERNTWRAIIQDAMHCMEKDEDEGVPSETEEDRRQHENRAKQIRELLRRKDEQIVSLLEEKVHIFRELSDCNSAPDHTNAPVRERMIFRATADDVTKGEPIIKDALKEVETLHALVNSGVGGAGCSVPVCVTGGSVGPVCLPRRAETFGGFDSHQMNSSKNGEKEEGDESLDLRRTESDSVLKKGATASLQILLKRNNEQVQHSVTHLHDLLISLQAVVVQQDSFIDDQRQALSERLTATSSRNSSSSSLSSSSSSRPSSLIEQEKHRSLERQRQEAASLQKQQVVHQEEKRKREKVWELKEKGLVEWEERLRVEEEETRRRRQELMEEKEALQRKKEEYQRELERLREAQRRLERDKEALTRDTERLEAMKSTKWEQLQTPFTTSKESIKFHSTTSLDLDSKEAAEEVELSSSAPTKEPFLRIGSKRMGKSFNPFASSSSSKPQGVEKEPQLPSRLLQLTKPKDKTDKKKKKLKGGEQAQTENKEILDPQSDGDIFFC